MHFGSSWLRHLPAAISVRVRVRVRAAVRVRGIGLGYAASACHRLRSPRAQHAPPVTLRRQVPRREAGRAYAGRALESTDVHASHHPRRTHPCRHWPLRFRAGGDRARGPERERGAKLAVEKQPPTGMASAGRFRVSVRARRGAVVSLECPLKRVSRVFRVKHLHTALTHRDSSLPAEFRMTLDCPCYAVQSVVLE